jgi:hypothetical protein
LLKLNACDTESIPHVSLIISSLMIGVGCVLFFLKNFLLSPSTFGNLVTRGDMIGRIEYSALGRYEIFPQPSFLNEIIRSWIFNLPFLQWGQIPAWFFAFVGVLIIAYACPRKNSIIDLSWLRVFGYLMVSSLILYSAARIFIFRMFVPSRYIEFSFNIFYCFAIAKCFRVAMNGGARA